VMEALVRLLSEPEPRELAHREHAPAVHARVHAARVRELARKTQLTREVHAGDVAGSVERLDGQPRDGERIESGTLAARRDAPLPALALLDPAGGALGPGGRAVAAGGARSSLRGPGASGAPGGLGARGDRGTRHAILRARARRL